MSDALEAAIRDAFDYRPLEGQQLYVKAEAALDAFLAELQQAREALETILGYADKYDQHASHKEHFDFVEAFWECIVVARAVVLRPTESS